jgi:short-subunit dehydrogenase involved in D-alanine esterification of teichoic acids
MPSINNSKTILVIGATSGIGRALAVALSELPTKPTVIVSGRRQDRLDELKAGKFGGGKIETIQFDQSADNESLAAFVNDVTAKYPDVGVEDLYARGLFLTDIGHYLHSWIPSFSALAYSTY